MKAYPRPYTCLLKGLGYPSYLKLIYDKYRLIRGYLSYLGATHAYQKATNIKLPKLFQTYL
jgi:hypothetical protein